MLDKVYNTVVLWLCLLLFAHAVFATDTSSTDAEANTDDPVAALKTIIQNLKDIIIPLIPAVEEFQENALALSKSFLNSSFVDSALQEARQYEKRTNKGDNDTLKEEVSQLRREVVSFRQIYNGLKAKGKNQKFSSNEMLHNLLYIAGVGEDLYIMDQEETIWKYDPATKHWNPWMTVPEWVKSSSHTTATTAIPNKGFVAAGSYFHISHSKDVVLLDVNLREAIDLPSLPRNTADAGLHYDGQCIYAIGSANYAPDYGSFADYTTSRMYRLCSTGESSWEPSWTSLRSHPSQSGTANAVILSTDDYLYTLGGFSADGDFFQHVARYSKASDTWELYDEMPIELAFSSHNAGAFFKGDNEILVYESDKLATFNMLSGETTFVDNNLTHIHGRFRVAKYRNHTMLLAEQSGASTKSYVYDHDTNELIKYHVIVRMNMRSILVVQNSD